ncbi:type-5 uracil-DNA glycosylase [Thermus tengchongensis]|uniref:Type-5 uracil-DNA glycosylase n=2 Tax=Thermus tengchongensis TaxID=1214928 RepID=A0A4Y9EZ11_9DEIN|nr:type-5 uracil-DNA glycosylase [Thermus tengchongensis]TFU17695.1 uracil-DNA glycosylase [Thermus tengchongensis]TFU25993.1 uracil-DNA glycosylase [Thermus tengchongensis]
MDLVRFREELTACRLCPRLVAWREEVGRTKRRAYRDWHYWAKPVPGFGDPQARLVLFGLAPGAHGSNRTGRPFTGDASGAFLYPLLYEAGLSSKPQSEPGDDLRLFGVYLTAAVRCAPPGNKPTREELLACSAWTRVELGLLPEARVYLALGRVALEALLDHFGLKKSAHPFFHGAHYPLPQGRHLLASYHVSRQNTQTGRLTREMFLEVLLRAKALAGL